MRTYLAYGLRIRSSFALAGMPPEDAGDACADLDLVLGERERIDALWSGPGGVGRETVVDGRRFRMVDGVDGDRLYTYGDEAAFHLSADLRTLTCSASAPKGLGWQRVLLDSVLTSVGYFNGLEALHSSSVAGPGGVVAFVTGSGGGKSTLAAELIARGWSLFSDDVLALRRRNGTVVGHPGPPLMNVALDGPLEVVSTYLGHTVAAIEGDAWVAVARACRTPRPLAAIVKLVREHGRATALTPIEGSSLPLLAQSLGTGDSAARTRSRFELMSDVAATVPAFVLEADPAEPPSVLADLVERELGPVTHPPLGAAA